MAGYVVGVGTWRIHLPKSQELETNRVGVSVTLGSRRMVIFDTIWPLSGNSGKHTGKDSAGIPGGLSEQGLCLLPAFMGSWLRPNFLPSLQDAPLTLWGSCYHHHLPVKWDQVSFRMFTTQQTCQITTRELASWGILFFFRWYIVVQYPIAFITLWIHSCHSVWALPGVLWSTRYQESWKGEWHTVTTFH